ncbi:PTPA-CTERM sorting domain-containing protein [[Limnothrix rosea] IAM M-220]|uniref:PTPA-CTERM sorting domain-containing protein n=1 Tax=[Limnothrix rosea] IAM M-220 TaxID=454133 RepID=UPI0009663C17|nr:PTPA-CTERM sorting domain-containing protein [[Limnothrix rosea] IAM M-220]OKH17970.1 hypothetical protein NIES208_07300 [[Limnothrix rosea] IAM M-220]
MKVSNQFVLSACGVVVLGFSATPAQALTLKTFTNESEFTAIATSLATETFNDATLSDKKNHVLDDFAIASNMTWSRIVDGSTAGNIDGSNFLRLQSRNSDTAAAFNFADSINAFGFDWANTDSNGDTLELMVGGQIFTFGLAGGSGFFGVIATDGDFDSVQFSDDAGSTFLQYGSIDNVRYGNVAPQAVPTPAAILPNLFLLGLNVLSRRGDRPTNP